MKLNSLYLPLLGLLLSASALAKVNAIEITERTAETQIKNLVEPLLDKYCRDQCKLMSVNASIDIASQDSVAPGFDDVETYQADKLAPSSAKIKLLIDDKVGPVSRTKLIDLIQQFLDTLDYPVKIDTQLAHFPTAIGSVGKANELRERVAKQFRSTLEDLFSQFCPQNCLLADYTLQSDIVNGEEAQYGQTGEYVQDGDVAIRIKDISATILVDEALTPEERTNIVQMARLKTNYFKNVTLNGKSIRFPHPEQSGATVGADGVLVNGVARRGLLQNSLNSKDERSEKSQLTQDQKLLQTNDSKATQDTRSTSQNEARSMSQNDAKTNNTNTNSENNLRQERFEHFEKIERVESGDAVQAELKKFKVYGLVFACSVLSLLIFLAFAGFRSKRNDSIRVSQSREPFTAGPADGVSATGSGALAEYGQKATQRYEIEKLLEELTAVFAQQPKVAKHVFSRVLTEEGIEICAAYIHLFGENIVIDMLRDPSLQSDLTELVEFYAKNPIDLDDDEKLELLKKLHNRTTAGKLFVMGNRSSNLFDFLTDMDGTQIMELVRNESLTVKSIILTQCDPQKRSVIYSHMDEAARFKLMGELSRIDYLPRDYIYNVSQALKRKRKENPKLNTEALPGSEVLISLLERTGIDVQRQVMNSLEASNPDSARVVKSKLVSLDTLQFLRDGQLLEVVLSLKHDELLIFLKGAPSAIKSTIFSKAPQELVVELDEELAPLSVPNRESYQSIERKILNRMKVMANEGLVNLLETNERMFMGAPDEFGSKHIETVQTESKSPAAVIPIAKAVG